MTVASARPKNLNLMSIRLPVPALVSILHRVSGLLLFLALPLLLLAFQASLRSHDEFVHVVRVLHHPLSKLLQWGLILSFGHHFLAGMRHLAMDVHWGTKLAMARLTGRLVLMLDGILSVMVVCWLW
jgi:succinate dehydrogenase / fumarate reductase cytochrome b subunit